MSTASMSTERNIAIDTLRTLSIILVIGIHSSGDYVMHYTDFDLNFFSILGLHSIVRMGVPLFVLISGAFVLGRAPYSWSDFYRHRLPRLLIPLAVWLPLYYVWFGFKGDDVGTWIMGLWQGEGYLHFWFLMMLITLYALTPLVDEVLRRFSSPRAVFALGFGLLSFGLLAYASDSLRESKPFFPLYYLYFLGYYVLGYAFRKYPIRRVGGYVLCYFLTVPLLFFVTYYFECRGWGDYPLDNLSPLIAIGSVSLFAVAASVPLQELRPNVLSRISPYVMGIYIVHIAVLHVVTKPFLIWAPRLMQQAWINVPIRIVLVVVLSLCAVQILKRIPYINKTMA